MFCYSYLRFYSTVQYSTAVPISFKFVTNLVESGNNQWVHAVAESFSTADATFLVVGEGSKELYSTSYLLARTSFRPPFCNESIRMCIKA